MASISNAFVCSVRSVRLELLEIWLTCVCSWQLFKFWCFGGSWILVYFPSRPFFHGCQEGHYFVKKQTNCCYRALEMPSDGGFSFQQAGQGRLVCCNLVGRNQCILLKSYFPLCVITTYSKGRGWGVVVTSERRASVVPRALVLIFMFLFFEGAAGFTNGTILQRTRIWLLHTALLCLAKLTSWRSSTCILQSRHTCLLYKYMLCNDSLKVMYSNSWQREDTKN